MGGEFSKVKVSEEPGVKKYRIGHIVLRKKPRIGHILVKKRE
ncbi:MAG: hypothetical protein ACUVQY_10725 [Thermoproteota archaeon]